MTQYNKVKTTRTTVTRSEEPQEARTEELARPNTVVKQRPKKAKKGLMERLVVGLIGPDGLPAAGRYITQQVIGPGLRDMLYDAVVNGAQMMILRGREGQNGPNVVRNSYSSPRKTTNYREAYRHSQPSYREDPARNTWQTDPGQAQQLGAGVILTDWAIGSREDAQRVMTHLNEIAYQYGQAKVRDYYDLIGVQSVYTDNSYGWKWDSLQNIRIRTTRDGWVLDLPPVEVM